MRPWAARSALPVTLLVQAAASAATIAPAAAAPRLLEALDLAPIAVGVYIAIVYLGAMVSSQWGAAWVRHHGPIVTSQWSLGGCAIGVFMVSFPNVAVAALGALLIGIGYGPITPASSTMLARTTSLERYALVFSIKQTGVPLGGAVAALLVPLALSDGRLPWALGQIALLCGLGIALAEILRRDLDAERNRDAPRPGRADLLRPLRFVLAHEILRKLAWCSMVFSATQVCLTSYVVTFLSSDLRWTLVAAGIGAAVAQLAGIAGRILWGLAADRRRDSRAILIMLTSVMMLCGLALGLTPPGSSMAWVLAVLALYGATAIGWNGVFLATVARLVPTQDTAAATSGSLFFTYFGVVVGPPIFGAIATWAGRLGIGFMLLAVPLVWAGVSLWRAGWRSHD